MRVVTRLTLCLFALLAFPIIAPAETPPLGIVTGPETGTYMAFGKDISRLASHSDLPVNTYSSNGSIENIRRIAEGDPEVSLGIVQSDVLYFLKRSEKPRSQAIAKRLRLVFPLYPEEIHVLARRDIASFNELRDRRVVIGEEGSGNMVTAMNLFALTGVRPGELIQVKPAEGIVKVLAGEADAMIFVGGKPVPIFQNLADLRKASGGRNAALLEQVHFLPLDDARIRGEYESAVLSAGDYPFIQGTVPTAAVLSVLISYDFSGEKDDYAKERCKQVGELAALMREHQDALRTMGHPKWKNVELARTLSLWQRDGCAWRNVGNTTPHVSSELEKDILEVIRGKK